MTKKALKILITIELICILLTGTGIVNISSAQTACRKTVAAVKSLEPESLKPEEALVLENAVEKVSEDVWTTEDTDYRTRPRKKGKSAGHVNANTCLKRTGRVLNGWSRVLVDGKEYYIPDKLLTTEAPVYFDNGSKGKYQQYALSLFSDFDWGEKELDPLIKLWNRESGWNPSSHNKYSGAHGIAQALPASKMASEGADYMTNGNTQIRWGLKYIKGRYGSPSAAWAHFTSHGWY